MRSSEKNNVDIPRTHLRVRHLRRRELPSGTLELAQFLIGKTLVHELPEGRLVGRIVETEGYPPGDQAAHAFRGMTPRNRSLFLKRGHAYVYFTYGSSFMLNITSEEPGVGAGVLIRALEPLEGIDLMLPGKRKAARACDLTRGPGRLAAAWQIDKRYDGIDVCAKGPLWLGAALGPPRPFGKSIRIGITRAVDRPFRYYERGNSCVSGPARLRR